MYDGSPESHRSSVQFADALDGLAVVIAAALLAVTLADRQSLPRVLLTLAFTCFVPGRAVVANWPQLAEWSAAIMSVVISISVLCLLALITLWAHYWHPLGLFQAEAAASLVAIGVSAARRHDVLGSVRRRGQRRAAVRALGL